MSLTIDYAELEARVLAQLASGDLSSIEESKKQEVIALLTKPENAHV